MGSAAAVVRDDILIVKGPFGALDCAFEFALDVFVVIEAVACTGVLVSCDDSEAEDFVAARLGPGLSLGTTGVVDIVVEDFEVDFVLPVARRAMISICEAVVSVRGETDQLKERGIKLRLYIRKRIKLSFFSG